MGRRGHRPRRQWWLPRCCRRCFSSRRRNRRNDPDLRHTGTDRADRTEIGPDKLICVQQISMLERDASKGALRFVG